MGGESILIAVSAAIAAAVLTVPFVVSARRRRLVTRASAALAELRRLNESYQWRLSYSAPIVYSWEDRVHSKAKFDRYDLQGLFFERLASLETEIDGHIAAQTKDMAVYSLYRDLHTRLGSEHLGKTESDRLNPEAFTRIERRLFAKRVLREPVCAAHVRCIVRYTSPQGRNSYVKSSDWNFEQLRNGLVEMRRIRETQSTAKFLRQQERNRMNASLRYQVLTRDNSMCKRCGATPNTHGVSLHVDHIIPVSKGGKTVLENLQTLCDTCNLGKGDRH